MTSPPGVVYKRHVKLLKNFLCCRNQRAVICSARCVTSGRELLGADRMNHGQFWDIVAKACRPTATEREWARNLIAELKCLSANEIVEWNHLFDELAFSARTSDLWAAAYIINGGASDDGFYYFRCWLIGMGKDVYGAAVADPDSLADVVTPPDPAGPQIYRMAETYAVAHQAWMAVTGRPDTDPYPARKEWSNMPVPGEDWNYDNEAEVRRRLPRLASIFLK
jgi:hypothetical protein